MKSALSLLLCTLIFSYSSNAQQNLPKSLPQKRASDIPSEVTPPKAAQTVVKKERKRINFDPNTVMSVTYTRVDWNLNSTAIDNSMIIFRDKNSGQTVQMELQETEPDSGIFSGRFAITWTNIKNVTPEVYDIPKSQIKDRKILSDIKTLIEKNIAVRKPYIMTRDERGLQSLDIYDTREQAEKALAIYKNKIAPQGKDQPIPTASDSVLEAEELAKKDKERKKREMDAKNQEAERSKLEDLERKKAEERIKQQQALSEADRKKRQKESAAFAEAALDYYRTGQFKLAEENFAKSVELDPENKANYFKYGVSLFKNDKFNQSLVYLQMASGKDFDPMERDFYVALCYYKQKEYNRALASFKKIEDSQHDPLGPSSAFYAGMVRFDDAQYDTAKQDFQRVLDTSKDPKLDERAESMMEKIDQLLMFAKNKAKMFIVSVWVGPQYDSNVLLVSDATASSGSGASSQGSARYQLGSSVEFRPIYEKSYEGSLKFKTDYYYTADDKLDDYDSWSLTGQVPLIYKGTVAGKGVKFELSPGYEKLYVGQDANSGQPKESNTSLLVDSLNTVVLSDSYFLGINIKYRQDKFKDTPASDASKINVAASNSIFFNSGKTKAVIADVGYTTNNSKGDDAAYNKIDLSALYMMPAFWELQFIGGVLYYSQVYNKQNPSRKDSNITGMLMLARPLTEWLKLQWTGNYITNSSNVASNNYKKYTTGVLLTAEYQF